ncbi:radical SAM protein [bacterium]|nr:radical SAM protein [bacterium]
MEEYTSCHWLQHGLSFENDHIEMCCLCCHKGGGKLHIKENYNGKGLDWDDIFALKDKYIDDNKNGIIDPRCEGCFNLVHRYWQNDEEHFINYIHFNHWTHCNCDCIYCYTSWDKVNFQKRPHYKVFPMIKELFKRKLFRDGGEVTFAGGEPTILNEFEDLTNFLVKQKEVKRITVHSSGIKYSKAIENGIKAGKLSVCLSPDSGTRETYKKVKRVDKFNKVWENIAKYASTKLVQEPQNPYYTKVETKFILIPEVNTTKNEIDNWLELSIKAGIKSIVIDVEDVYCKKILAEDKEMPDYLVELSKYIVQRAKELNLNLVQYNNFCYLTTKYCIE